MSGSVHSQLPRQRHSLDPQQPSPMGVGSPGEWAVPGSSRGSHKLKTSEGTSAGESVFLLQPLRAHSLLCL